MTTKNAPDHPWTTTEQISLSALASVYPAQKVDDAIVQCDRKEERKRLLPARVVLYFVIALALFSESAYREVMQKLVEALRLPGWFGDRWKVPTGPAITLERQRLGVEPLKALFAATARPIATPETDGAWYRGWHVTALDGTVIDVPDSETNVTAFGKPGVSRGTGSALPQVRIVSLVECGTHAHFAFAEGPLSSGETTLTRQVLGSLRAGILNLADRNFYGYKLWNEARATGADLLWRVKKNVILAPEKWLEDGSYLTTVYPSSYARQKGKRGVIIRVIEYTLDDPGRTVLESYRLITTVLDPKEAPAAELAVLYCERQEFEIAEDEFKTHLRGAQRVLRSHTPDGVRQEIYSYFLAHFAIRVVMHDAALQRGIDPDRLSFAHALRVIQRKIIARALFPPQAVYEPASGDPG